MIASYNGGFGRHQCKRCGWCCQNQLISASTVEIRAIIDFLNHKTKEELEEHITSSLAYEGQINLYHLNFKKGLKRLANFYKPYALEVFKGKIALVRDHVINSLPVTKICVFYDPLSSGCLIYNARPLTCRMFPFEIEGNNFILVNEGDRCPGLGFGEIVDIRRHRRLSMMCKKLLYEDDKIFWKFVSESGLIRNETGRTISIYDVELVDPFIKLGLIPTQDDN